jgi:hypothetical protein
MHRMFYNILKSILFYDLPSDLSSMYRPAFSIGCGRL